MVPVRHREAAHDLLQCGDTVGQVLDGVGGCTEVPGPSASRSLGAARVALVGEADRLLERRSEVASCVIARAEGVPAEVLAEQFLGDAGAVDAGCFAVGDCRRHQVFDGAVMQRVSDHICEEVPVDVIDLRLAGGLDVDREFGVDETQVYPCGEVHC